MQRWLTNWSRLSMFMNLSRRSRIWIQSTLMSDLLLEIRISKCKNTLQSNADARKRVSGMPWGSRWKTSDLSNSSNNGKTTRLNVSSTWAWSSSLVVICGPRRILWSWDMALCRTPRHALEDWCPRAVSNGRLYTLQAINQMSSNISSGNGC